MVYPTQDDIFYTEPLLEWIDDYFLRTDPFAFSDAGFRPTVRSISSKLDIDSNGVFCIGSGAIGLSINPGKVVGGALKPFDLESDLDFAFISEVYFETAWRDLRRAAQATLEPNEVLAKALGWQKKRFFDGAIVANELLPVLSFGNEWVTAMVAIQEQIAITLDRDVPVNMWIYRDYWSLRNYVASGVIACRKKAGLIE